MHFLTSVVVSTVALQGLAMAAPATGGRTTTVQPPALFKLQTQVKPGIRDCGTDKNNLWLTSYHTGAGLGDATLTPNKTIGWAGYLNGTQQLFNESDLAWPLSIGYEAYSYFSPVTISAASSASSGFYYNETGLQYNGSFGGWLVCDWWHGEPQLFNIATMQPYVSNPYPRSCSKVNLLPVAVSQ